jgi:DNA-binding protein HU-beta
MKKPELVAAIAAAADMTKADAEKALNATTDAITSELAKGGSLSLIGFGTFSVKDRGERTGRNPQTGASMTIAASKAPGFKPGKALKDAVNG